MVEMIRPLGGYLYFIFYSRTPLCRLAEIPHVGPTKG